MDWPPREAIEKVESWSRKRLRESRMFFCVDHVEIDCLGRRIIGHFDNGQYVDRSRCLRRSFLSFLAASVFVLEREGAKKRWRYRVVRRILTVETGGCAS